MALSIDLADARTSELDDWLRQQQAVTGGYQDHSQLHRLPSDASHRRYFRLTSDQERRLLVVDWPPEYGSCRVFEAIARSWREQGLHTPAIHAVDNARGFMVMEDLGDQLLYSRLVEQIRCNQDPQACAPYRKALAALQRLQAVREPDGYSWPLYDPQFLRQEMALFTQWCTSRLLGLRVPDSVQSLLDDCMEQAVSLAQAQPQVPVHRDYHSRNIMILPETGDLGIIDFQDAVAGPVTYDLVSLLRDCYLDWPQALVYQWLDDFAAGSPHLQGVSSGQLRQWFDWMGLQRHLKVLGIFARLHVRDAKSDYLQFLPRVFAYICEVCRVYPELHNLYGWLQEDLLPCFQKQPWWWHCSLQQTHQRPAGR